MSNSDNGLEQLRAALLGLTPAQQVAVEALVGDATHAAAAEASGVTRETVTRWAGHLPAFRATMNLCRAAIVAEQIDVARRIRGKAMAAVELALDKGQIDPLAVLRTLGDSTSSVGHTIPEEILDAELNKTRLALPPMPLPEDVDDILESLRSPSSDIERAESLTITRLATAAGIPPVHSATTTP